jgi:hypothetical protein
MRPLEAGNHWQPDSELTVNSCLTVNWPDRGAWAEDRGAMAEDRGAMADDARR